MDNPYIPRVVRIDRIFKETPDVKTFSLKCRLDFVPGQFLEVSSFGAGEAPISISAGPQEKSLRITFKRIGSVTESLFDLKRGDSIGIRGPFGNGFPLKSIESKNLLFISGGVGLAPLRSLLGSLLSGKGKRSGDITLLYGSRSAKDLLYKKDLKDWARHIKVLLTVDKADAGWKGPVGVVPQLLNEIKFDPLTTKAVLCGPGVMMRFTTARLVELGMKPRDIILSLERYMKCGVGKCGHCYMGDKYVCQDGPVFTLEELNSLVPKEIL